MEYESCLPTTDAVFSSEYIQQKKCITTNKYLNNYEDIIDLINKEIK